MIWVQISQFVGLRPTMEGSVILRHVGDGAVRGGGRVRFVASVVVVERVSRLRGVLLRARDKMGRRLRKEIRMMVGRCMVG